MSRIARLSSKYSVLIVYQPLIFVTGFNQNCPILSNHRKTASNLVEIRNTSQAEATLL